MSDAIIRFLNYPALTHDDVREREDLLPILTSRERPHRRVEQLLQGLQP